MPRCSALVPNGTAGALGMIEPGPPGMPPGDAALDAGMPKPLGRPGAAVDSDDVGRFGA